VLLAGTLALALAAADTPVAAPPPPLPPPLPAEQPARARERFFGEDKWKHFFTSFLATSLAASGARAAGVDPDAAIWVGAGAGAALGAGKELADLRGAGSASLYDVIWDLGGVGAATLVQLRAR
jgi:uncharacterized protein YfiM (DUF2279 family)